MSKWSTPGVLYGLPKVHKPGCPFRPIVSSINTYNYNLASYLVHILQPISTNQFTIKDSFSFADWAKTYTHNNEMMCSFDVSSLFTNVPLDETIQICLDKLYALPDPPTLPRSVLKVLLEFATKKSHFIFDGQYYDQVDGVAMGSPLGPVLANIFMRHFEEKWVLSNNSRPSVWFRYVDDTFTLFESKHAAIRFLQFLNNCHANIKFTFEFEENSTIPCLDSHHTPQSHFLDISLPKEDIHRPVHKMGLLHAQKIQDKPHPYANFSLFSHLLVTFSTALFIE